MNNDLEWIYGRRAVQETLIAQRRSFEQLLVAEGSKHHPRIKEIVEIANRLGVETNFVPRSAIESIVSSNHQGVVLSASSYPYLDWLDLEEIHRKSEVILALDSLNDPKNVGTLLRTAEAVGVGGVVIPTDRAVGITPSVVNASAGSTEHLNIVREVNLVRWLNMTKSNGFWVAGLSAEPSAENLFDVETPLPLVLVVGAEGDGMRRLVRQSCDMLISLPMYGKISSLNAAVAGSIALYEIREFSGVR